MCFICCCWVLGCGEFVWLLMNVLCWWGLDVCCCDVMVSFISCLRWLLWAWLVRCLLRLLKCWVGLRL